MWFVDDVYFSFLVGCWFGILISFGLYVCWWLVFLCLLEIEMLAWPFFRGFLPLDRKRQSWKPLDNLRFDCCNSSFSLCFLVTYSRRFFCIWSTVIVSNREIELALVSGCSSVGPGSTGLLIQNHLASKRSSRIHPSCHSAGLYAKSCFIPSLWTWEVWMHAFDDSKVIVLNLDVFLCRLQEEGDDSSEMVSRPAAASQILRFAVGWGVGCKGTACYRPVDEMFNAGNSAFTQNFSTEWTRLAHPNCSSIVFAVGYVFEFPNCYLAFPPRLICLVM